MEGLAPFRLPDGPPAMYYVPEFLTAEQEARYVAKIAGNERAWVTLSNRRLQMYGGTPSDKGMAATPLPGWLMEVVKQLRKHEYTTDALNHVLVNEYAPGQGIMAHEDGPLYTPHFAIVSQQSALLLDFFRKGDEPLSERFETSVYLEPRSALIISEAAYTDYLHGIEARMDDELDPARICNFREHFPRGERVARQPRISMTIRQVRKTISTSKLFGARK